MTPFPLRPYQQKALEAIQQAYRAGITRPLVALPTGTGKTVVFAHLCQQRPGRSLILVHRDELVRQTIDKVRQIAPELATGVVQADRDDHDASCVIASVPTLSRPARLARFTPDVQTIVVDEAHHALATSYRRVLDHCGAFSPHGPLTVGVTATPERGDKQSLRAIFDTIVYQQSLRDMIGQGYLSDLRAVIVRVAVNLDQVVVRHGDFVDGDLGRVLMDADAPQHVLAAVRQHAPDRKALVFTPTVAVAHAMADTFRRAGIAAEALDGQTPRDQRRAMLDRFHTGATQIVSNCAVLTEGFDEPSVDCIILCRPTQSRGLYQQMIGRGTRLHPGKSDCLILDVVGVSTQHRLVTLARLLDMAPEALHTRSVCDVLEEQERHPGTARDTPDGELVHSAVDLFAQRPVHWVQTRGGRWMLGLGAHGTVRLEPDGPATWQVLRVQRDMAAVVLHAGLPLAYAQGCAEDIVRRMRVDRLVATDAPWRQQPASAKQVEALRRWGVRVRPGMTKGEASDMMTALVGDWR